MNTDPDRCECGGLARAYPYIPASWDGRAASILTRIRCELCGAATAPFDNYEAALHRWNRRPSGSDRLLAAWRAGRDAMIDLAMTLEPAEPDPRHLNPEDFYVDRRQLSETIAGYKADFGHELARKGRALPDPSPAELESIK